MAGLTKEQRDKLPSTEFAVPAQRKLPIHDKQHLVLAWSASDALQGDERLEAKRAILRKAHTLKVDTRTWHLQSTVLEARGIDFGTAEEHCNRLPFSGVLAFVDEPSDKPVGGAGGRRVLLTRAAAETALDSLIGMAVDFTPAFDGHAPTRKIGLMTGSELVGNELRVSGYFWAADFPEEVALITKDKDKLGFSYECRSMVLDDKADPLVVAAAEFTGAAVLYKDKAAYMKTSLAARADHSGELTMEKDVKDAFDAINGLLSGLPNLIKTEAGSAVTVALNAQAEAEKKTKIDAGKAQVPVLRQSASALRTQGLAAAADVLDAQANQIEIAVNAGQVPPEFKPGMTNHQQQQQQTPAALTAAALEPIMKPVLDAVGALTTKVSDLTTKVDAGGSQTPQRKSLSASASAALAKIGLTPADGKKLTIAEFDAAAEKSNLPRMESMAMKIALQAAGQLEEK